MYTSPHVEGLYINEEFVSANQSGELAVLWPEEQFLKMGDSEGHNIFKVSTAKPEYFINKWQWWNVLIPSPYGYLSKNSDVEMVWINLPMKEYLSFGPWWIRSWFTIFVAGMITFSLLIKLTFKIE